MNPGKKAATSVYRQVVRAAMKEFKRKYPERKYFDTEGFPYTTYQWNTKPYNPNRVAFSSGRGLPLQTIRIEAKNSIRRNNLCLEDEQFIHKLMRLHHVSPVPMHVRFHFERKKNSS